MNAKPRAPSSGNWALQLVFTLRSARGSTTRSASAWGETAVVKRFPGYGKRAMPSLIATGKNVAVTELVNPARPTPMRKRDTGGGLPPRLHRLRLRRPPPLGAPGRDGRSPTLRRQRHRRRCCSEYFYPAAAWLLRAAEERRLGLDARWVMRNTQGTNVPRTTAMNAASVTSSERSCDGIWDTTSSASGIIFWDTVLAASGLTAGAKAAAPVRRSARSFIVLRDQGGRGEFLSLAVSLHLCVCVCVCGDGAAAATAYRGPPPQLDLDRAAKRVPSATKISPAAIGAIAATGETSP